MVVDRWAISGLRRFWMDCGIACPDGLHGEWGQPVRISLARSLGYALFLEYPCRTRLQLLVIEYIF